MIKIILSTKSIRGPTAIQFHLLTNLSGSPEDVKGTYPGNILNGSQ
jgi:hypothetical protein